MNRGTVRARAVGITCVFALLGSAAVTLPAIAVAPAASPTAPTVDLTSVPSSPLRATVTFSAYAAASAGRTITSVAFQSSPAGANSWTTFDTETVPTAPNQYAAQNFDTSSSFPNGIYDFRAVAIDSAGESTASAVASDLTVSNNATYVPVATPGSPVAGKVTLTATPEAGGFTPDTVTFSYCPTSADCPANPGSWRSLPNATVGPQLDDSGNPTGNYVYTFDTSDKRFLPQGDGSYDFGVTAADGNQDPFQGGAISDVVVDNTAPTVTVNDPGRSLSGSATLTASAQDPGSGVAAVKFEVAPAGTGTWTTVGVASSPPYSASFDTRQFADGGYDIRAEVSDNAGNTATSTTVSGVTVANPGAQPFAGLTLTNYLPPASNITLIGELPGAEHETWAIGQTNAPPPTVNGTPLPYTASGNHQIVLLRYTDDTGWQIVDVLRNSDGSPFPLLAGGTAFVSGAMTASGEAWITLRESPSSPGTPNIYGVFHRLPGGAFELDSGATQTLKPLLNGAVTIRLDQGGDGVLVSSNQSPISQTVPSPNGPVSVTTELAYGQLVGGGWTLKGSSLPASYTAPSGVTAVTLKAADVTGPGTGWAAIEQDNGPLILARFDQNGWTFLPQTGLDAFDLTGPFAAGSQQSVAAQNPVTVQPIALRADGTGLWLSATLGNGTVVARYDAASGRVVNSWCSGLPRQDSACASPLDLDHPAIVPDATFDNSAGPTAEGLTSGFLDLYYHGAWTSVAAPGFPGIGVQVGLPGLAVFADPTDGWIVGRSTLARVSGSSLASRLASWPEANRNPLLSVALPPGQSTTDTPGALAVGLNGTALHYDASAGWQVDATPPQTHHIQLTGVAFAGPSLAFAVGQAGMIVRWDGTGWTKDPQALRVTTKTLNAVAFGSGGQGWAVGALGTILHYDGTAWSSEQIDSQDSLANITSVAVAGQDVYAIAGGNLIMRTPGGTWQRVPASLLPTPLPPTGSLQLVSGIPDGGVAVAGKSLLMVKQSASGSFSYSPQSFNDIPVALAAFRDASGSVRALVSVAPPIETSSGPSNDDGGFPAGDGDLLLETDGGWQDLSRDLPAGSQYNATGDGVVQPDPVLAVAASPDGTHAWAVGGYAGTHAADGVGSDQILQARSSDWFTSAIWRYDAGGSASSPATSQDTVDLPAAANTVSFAFFSSALCKVQCAAVQGAQPDVNLRTAATQIAAFAQQPGGPAFEMLGGNARGTIDGVRGSDPIDLAALPQLLSPLSGVPTYAAYGPLDSVATSSDPALPWAEDFASAPAPFGQGAAPPGITTRGSGDPTGPVSKYYAFDVSQNGGTLRAIVLDNSAGSLEASAPGQTAWLSSELSEAQSWGLPVVVFAAKPLNVNDTGAATDADSVAAQLAAAGVLAVFTASGGGNGSANQADQIAQVPADAAPGAAQIPEYEGAALTYQQPANNGVLWYDVSIDTAGRAVSVKAIPVISSLALEPLNGLSAARSSTLSFQAIGRRPEGTIATTPLDPGFPGYDQYVGIPSKSCSGCIGPSYSFQSSNPVVGNFVVPSAPGSSFPKLSATGATTASSTSGLFCAFNSGTTTVSVTSGLLTSSLTVTVASGGYGPPCGTVPGGSSTNVIHVPGKTTVKAGSNPGIGNPNTPLSQSAVNTPLPKIAVPPPPPVVAVPAAHLPAAPHKPVPQPTPNSVPLASGSPTLTPSPSLGPPVVVLPLLPPPVTPVPPGGATASAQATSKREEKARKHASQSAYVIRPAGTSATDWFFPAVAGVSVLALLLIAGGLRPRPDARLALVELRDPDRRRGR